MASFLTFILFAVIIFRVVMKSSQAQKPNRPNQYPGHQSQNQPVYQSQPVRQQQRQQQKHLQRNQTIVDRAKQNTARYQADTTKQQMESEHRHSESVKSTGVKEYAAAQKEAHPHDAAHVARELDAQEGTLLATVEDLMVKGVDTSLSFERDFVGEAMDMINSFAMPNTESGK